MQTIKYFNPNTIILIFSRSHWCCRQRPHFFDGRDQLLRLAGARGRKIFGRKFQQKHDRLQGLGQRVSQVLENVSEVSDVDVKLFRRVGIDLRNRKNLLLKALAGGACDAAQQEIGRSRRTGWSRCWSVGRGGSRYNAGAERKDSLL